MISCCGPDGSSRREGGGVNVDKSLVRIGSGFVAFHVGLIRSVVSVSFLVPLLPRVVFLDLLESCLVEGNVSWNAASLGF